MGKDVAGFHSDKRSNTVDGKSNGTNGTIRVAPKALPEKSGKDECETTDHDANNILPDEFNDKQDVLGLKSTNHQPEEKIIKVETQKSAGNKLISPAKTGSGSAVDGTIDTHYHANGAENSDSEVLPKSSDIHSPIMSAKKSQANSNLLSRKQLQPRIKNYYDEDDNWSLASSTATSVRTKITVAVAPRFTCEDRFERRKEFYSKLGEKHKALEKEKLEYQARTKEEEQAAIKQLRKTMTYKANPVPSFYHEGPPPKVELKKLPVTRAKSPNLTRRNSCGDAVKSSPEDKGSCGRATRHSVGVYREGKASPLQKKAGSPLPKKSSPVTAKSKDQSNGQRPNGPNTTKNRPQQSKPRGNEEIAINS